MLLSTNMVTPPVLSLGRSIQMVAVLVCRKKKKETSTASSLALPTNGIILPMIGEEYTRKSICMRAVVRRFAFFTILGKIILGWLIPNIPGFMTPPVAKRNIQPIRATLRLMNLFFRSNVSASIMQLGRRLLISSIPPIMELLGPPELRRSMTMIMPATRLNILIIVHCLMATGFVQLVKYGRIPLVKRRSMRNILGQMAIGWVPPKKYGLLMLPESRYSMRNSAGPMAIGQFHCKRMQATIMQAITP